MSWPATPPPHVAQLRTQWQACAAWTGAGGSLGSIHYPTCNLSGDRGTLDTLPAMLIESAPTTRRQFAEGALGILAGEFSVVLYLDAATYPDAAACEALADEIVADLLSQHAGMVWHEPQRSDASNPTPGARAASAPANPTDFRSVRIALPWGIQP